MTIIERRVANGAALLDREIPNWRNKVDPSTLNIDNPQRCVLGQIYGDYYYGEAVLRIGRYEARQNGLYCTSLFRSLYYWRLTKAWRKEIERTLG